MSELDTVRERAKDALIIPIPKSGSDDFLWDRARRLVRSVEYICRLPELTEASLSVNRFCLTAATYFSNTGLAHYLKAEKTAPKPANFNAYDNGLLDISTEIVAEKLADVIEKTKIEKINAIIVESGNRLAKRTEAMILSDARNLDDMGAAGIFNEFRRLTCQGKGVYEVLQIWKRKIDYRYWQARLKKSFRFEAVRKLAQRRLAVAEHFMNQLKVEAEALDMQEWITEENRQEVNSGRRE